MTEMSKALYKGKFFYEVSRKGKQINLVGPLTNIRYISTAAEEPNYAFAQVIDGVIVQAFKANEILVLNHKI